MATYKTTGIVLKSNKLGEADKIISIYSDSCGKIQGVAKGIRRTKSKFGSRLEPFTYVDLLLYKGRNLDIITQVEIISSFKEIREDYDRVTYGWAMLDLINKVSLEGEKENKLFYLLLKTLELLSKATSNLDLLLVAFDIKLLAIVGYRPNLSSCTVCHRKLTSDDKFLFSFEWGGIICNPCSTNDIGAINVSLESIVVLKKLLFSELELVFKIEASKEVRKELENLINKYIDYYIQSRLKSRKLLGDSKHA